MNIIVLISKTSWAQNYKKEIKKKIKKYCKNLKFISNHKLIKKKNDINIIFSYFKIIENKYLNYSKYNLIPHESNLPLGKGMSPLTWQILKGRSKIVFSLIEAQTKIDSGKIFFKKIVKVPNTCLFDEIKKIQFENNILLIEKFLKLYKKNKKVIGKKQVGRSTFFKIRKPGDHEINVNKSIRSQFNILRTSDNKYYPSFFKYKGKKYLIKITKQ